MSKTYEDKISALSDDLLVTMLMLIPIREAVSTMILSKRWRFIWTMLPRLEYEDINDEQFLDKSLQLHKAPVLSILVIKLGRLCPKDANVRKWIAKAVDRGVKNLEFDLFWSKNPIGLPKTLYSCKSLKKLNLSYDILLDIPSSVYLPSLIELQLNRVVYKTDDSLVNLLSSCPNLKSLSVIRRSENDNLKKFIVKAPRLLDLTYINYCYINNDLEEEEDIERCLVIDTPALTDLRIVDKSRESGLIENKSCFKQVYIERELSFPSIDKFLRSFSQVLDLELVLIDEMIMCCSNIKFSRLTKCKIVPQDSYWMDSLVFFLQNTPKLKTFIVDYKYTNNPATASLSWRELSCVPECLLSSLEKFELIDYGGRREEEEELVEYILMNSKCLKTATISFKSILEVADRETMMEKLKAIPRRSITSQLLFKYNEY